MRRLRKCGLIGIAGLAAAIYIVISLVIAGPFDFYAVGGIAGWLIVAVISWLCFRVVKLERAGRRGPLPSLKWLSLTALIFPGLFILGLAPWSLAVGVARLVEHGDIRELVFVVWGLLGLLYFVVLGMVLFSIRQLLNSARANQA